MTQDPSEKALRLNADELNAFLESAFPHTPRSARAKVVSAAPGHVRMRLDPSEENARPGGIVSGPTQMGLADAAAYVMVLAHIGPVAMAVTQTLNMTFLRACRMETVHADARLLKLGRRFATIDVKIWQGEEDRLVAQAIVGYALP